MATASTASAREWLGLASRTAPAINTRMGTNWAITAWLRMGRSTVSGRMCGRRPLIVRSALWTAPLWTAGSTAQLTTGRWVTHFGAAPWTNRRPPPVSSAARRVVTRRMARTTTRVTRTPPCSRLNVSREYGKSSGVACLDRRKRRGGYTVADWLQSRSEAQATASCPSPKYKPQNAGYMVGLMNEPNMLATEDSRRPTPL